MVFLSLASKIFTNYLFHIANLTRCFSNLKPSNIYSLLGERKEKWQPAHPSVFSLCHVLTSFFLLSNILTSSFVYSPLIYFIVFNGQVLIICYIFMVQYSALILLTKIFYVTSSLLVLIPIHLLVYKEFPLFDICVSFIMLYYLFSILLRVWWLFILFNIKNWYQVSIDIMEILLILLFSE